MTTLCKFTEWHWVAPGRVETNPVQLTIDSWHDVTYVEMFNRYALARDRMIIAEVY
jgi:hypothetical protein